MFNERHQPVSLEDFRNVIKSRIPQAAAWGQGETKTIEHLYEEIQERDCFLSLEGEDLVRFTWPVFLIVRYADQGYEYELFEEKQVFDDGRVRQRVLPGSIGEKGKYKEDPSIAASRAISEELKAIPLSFGREKPKFERRWCEDEEARSYPGLRTRSQNYLYVITLPPNQGMPQSFEEVEHGKTTFFNWRILTPKNQ